MAVFKPGVKFQPIRVDCPSDLIFTDVSFTLINDGADL